MWWTRRERIGLGPALDARRGQKPLRRLVTPTSRAAIRSGYTGRPLRSFPGWSCTFQGVLGAAGRPSSACHSIPRVSSATRKSAPHPRWHSRLSTTVSRNYSADIHETRVPPRSSRENLRGHGAPRPRSNYTDLWWKTRGVRRGLAVTHDIRRDLAGLVRVRTGHRQGRMWYVSPQLQCGPANRPRPARSPVLPRRPGPAGGASGKTGLQPHAGGVATQTGTASLTFTERVQCHARHTPNVDGSPAGEPRQSTRQLF
jgi:hypothetical protein